MILFGVLINPVRFSSQFACSVVSLSAFLPLCRMSDPCENTAFCVGFTENILGFLSQLMAVKLTGGRLKQMCP